MFSLANRLHYLCIWTWDQISSEVLSPLGSYGNSKSIPGHQSNGEKYIMIIVHSLKP
jgi:hypothetical protein